MNVHGDPKAFALVKDHHLVRFQMEEECGSVPKGGPWLVHRWTTTSDGAMGSHLHSRSQGGAEDNGLGPSSRAANRILGSRFVVGHRVKGRYSGGDHGRLHYQIPEDGIRMDKG